MIEDLTDEQLDQELIEALKRELRPIMMDESLTKDQRSAKMLPFLKSLTEVLDFDEASSAWNQVMAELVEELGMRRH